MKEHDKNRENPNEIPTHKHPDHKSPLKDPLSPNEQNPINPHTDEEPSNRND